MDSRSLILFLNSSRCKNSHLMVKVASYCLAQNPSLAFVCIASGATFTCCRPVKEPTLDELTSLLNCARPEEIDALYINDRYMFYMDEERTKPVLIEDSDVPSIIYFDVLPSFDSWCSKLTDYTAREAIWCVSFGPNDLIKAASCNRDDDSEMTNGCMNAPDCCSNLCVVYDTNGREYNSSSVDTTFTFYRRSDYAMLCVVFSPDRSTVATSRLHDSFKLWSTATGKCLQKFTGHENLVTCGTFSQDGQTIVSGSSDHTLKLWSAATGSCIRTLKGHKETVTSVALSLNGQTVASGSRDGTLKLWTAATGICIRTFRGHDGSVTSVAFSPDGQTIVSGSYDKTLKVWSTNGTKECLKTLQGHQDYVNSVAFSSDGAKIVSASPDRSLKVWGGSDVRCPISAISASDLLSVT